MKESNLKYHTHRRKFKIKKLQGVTQERSKPPHEHKDP